LPDQIEAPTGFSKSPQVSHLHPGLRRLCAPTTSSSSLPPPVGLSLTSMAAVICVSHKLRPGRQHPGEKRSFHFT